MIISISWSQIVAQFNTKYDEIYLERYAKAYLDYGNHVIEGAKERWQSTVLLDALVCFVQKQDPSYRSPKELDPTSRQPRRQFDQHKVLSEKVKENLSSALQAPITGRDTNSTSTITKSVAINTEFTLNLNIPEEWTSFKLLSTHILNCSSNSKSLQRRTQCIKQLIAYKGLKDKSLSDILLSYVSCIATDMSKVGSLKVKTAVLQHASTLKANPQKGNNRSKSKSNKQISTDTSKSNLDKRGKVVKSSDGTKRLCSATTQLPVKVNVTETQPPPALLPPLDVQHSSSNSDSNPANVHDVLTTTTNASTSKPASPPEQAAWSNTLIDAAMQLETAGASGVGVLLEPTVTSVDVLGSNLDTGKASANRKSKRRRSL